MARKRKMKTIDWVAISLLIIGGLVHGGQAFGYYAVEKLINFVWLQKTIYIVVGLSALYSIWSLYKVVRK